MESQKLLLLATRCALMLPLTLLASCATTTVGSVTELPAELKQPSFCSVAKGISWSSHDTAQTVWEIKEHNAVGATLCGWKGR